MASKIKCYYEKQFLTFYTRIIYNVILQGEMQMNTKLLEDAINEYISLGINRQLDYDRFYLYSIITHSTAIEGSTVSEIENQLLFDECSGIVNLKQHHLIR